MKRMLALAAAVLALAGASWVYDNYYGRMRDAMDRRRYPSIESPESRLSASMDKEIEQRQIQRVAEDYGRVQAMLAEAEEQGFDVRILREKLPRVQRLIQSKDYFSAGLHLRSIRLRVPRRTEQVRVAAGDEGADDYFPQPQGRPQKKARLLRSP